MRVDAGRGNFAKILLVAGPSGCGKSTLIGALRQGRLAASALPESARDWPLMSGKDLLRDGLPAPDGGAAPGLIVHYDTMRVITQGFDDHLDDPAIKILEAAAGPILVVTVAPPREMLFAQFLERVRVRADGMAPAPGRFARLKRGLRQVRRRAFGAPPLSVPRMEINKLAVYGSDRKLFHLNTRWQASLDRLAAARGDVHRLIAVPAPDAGGVPAFRLAPAPFLEAMPLDATPHEATRLGARPSGAPRRASA
jgi:energy-coupling factor transporter ATP-binding protein EcfA2